MSKLSRYFRKLTAPFRKRTGANYYNTVRKESNRKEISNKDFSARLTHNLNTIIEELWIPNEKLETMLGCSIISDNLRVPHHLSDEDLAYCYAQATRYIAAVWAFSEVHSADLNKFTDATVYNMDCDMLRTPEQKKKVDKSMFDVKYIKKLWAKSVDEAKADLSEMPTDRDELIKDTEGKLRGIMLMFRLYFTKLYMPMAYARVDFRADKKPLYNLHS